MLRRCCTRDLQRVLCKKHTYGACSTCTTGVSEKRSSVAPLYFVIIALMTSRHSLFCRCVQVAAHRCCKHTEVRHCRTDRLNQMASVWRDRQAPLPKPARILFTFAYAALVTTQCLCHTPLNHKQIIAVTIKLTLNHIAQP